MDLDTKLITRLVDRILSCREQAVPGSETLLRGSPAGDMADQYSDIDVLWEILKLGDEVSTMDPKTVALAQDIRTLVLEALKGDA